jgi:cytochrome c biogenesis protein CcmG/thiol:disulfide interchange protein DsbE
MRSLSPDPVEQPARHQADLDQSSKSRWLWMMILLMILGAGWIVLSRDFFQPARADGKPQAAALPRKDYTAPDFTLQTLDGRSMTLSDLRGQAVLINFWATWCPPCRLEMPAIQQVYDQYRDQGFEVLAVNLQEQNAQVSAFAEEMGLTFPILFDRDGSVSHTYLVRSLPTTFFVDRFGLIQEVIIGGPIPHALIESTIAPLLAQEDGV